MQEIVSVLSGWSLKEIILALNTHVATQEVKLILRICHKMGKVIHVQDDHVLFETSEDYYIK